MKVIYCVKFEADNHTYFGFKYRGREKPEGLSYPEAKCAIRKRSVALALANKYRRESSFSNIRVLETQIK